MSQILETQVLCVGRTEYETTKKANLDLPNPNPPRTQIFLTQTPWLGLHLGGGNENSKWRFFSNSFIFFLLHWIAWIGFVICVKQELESLRLEFDVDF